MNRIILIVVCLLAAAPAMAAEPGNLFDTPSWESDVPRRFIRIDPVSAGPCRLGTLEGGWWNWSGTLLKACLLYTSDAADE